nr:hypothetical protein [Gammaproteobacteria bacterium]
MIKESDWKKFKDLKEAALERFCAEVLDDSSRIIEQSDGSSHSKYLLLYKVIQDADRTLASLFEYHSRSKATIQLMMLRTEGLIKDEELQELSEEFRKSTEPLL